MDLKELDSVDPSEHWYYQAKLTGLRHALRAIDAPVPHVLDVGAGSGFFGLNVAPDARVTCVDPNYADDQLSDDGRVAFVRTAESASAGIILFIDVLEHVDDDLGLLRSYVSGAHAGAIVVISVPAFSSMWSGHDVFLEHRRRYRLNEISDVAIAAGLEILDRRYLFGLVFPAAWLLRRLRPSDGSTSDLKPLNAFANRWLRSACSLEHRVVRNTVLGLSAVIVARVPGDHQ